MAHTHHEDHSEAAAFGVASWMVAMALFVVAMVILAIAMFAWAPWDDDATTTPGGDVPGAEEGADEGGADIDIDGNIDVDDGDGGSNPNGGN